MRSWLADPEGLALLLLVLHVVIGAIAVAYISARRRPATAIAWMLTIIFIPYVGIVAFMLVGFTRLPKARRDKQKHVNEMILARTEGLDQLSHRDDWPKGLSTLVTLNNNLGALPMVGGNDVELLPDYHGSIAAMAREIDTATDYVHVEFYILVDDDVTRPFFDALERACRRGVTVRVLSDHLAALMNPGRKETLTRLAAMGAEYHAMLPLRPWKGNWQRVDLRNHRKLLVVDGRVGFAGSQNMVNESYNKKKNIARGLRWHELMMRVHGPVVRELDAVFVTDWFSETDVLLELDTSPVVLNPAEHLVDAQVVPSGPSFENDNSLKLFVSMIHQATERVSITSPYFVPEDSVLLAIIAAAGRGLSVELFVSEIGDQAMVYHAQRSYYEALLRAGVKIYLYKSPEVLHSKHFSIDSDVAVIGSSNMDIRSFALNMEISVLIHSASFVAQMRDVEDGYRSNSRDLRLEDWIKRPRWEKFWDSAARLTSNLQ
ncbi:cardiolipin synthase [Arthrobacter sp. H35-D1]|uniref:cardiolipin synthase n=1 Tax=Arthrobacter sp. H35-D1 TaxID=3046202 RepID=UPI0024B9030D|nr:cardiolipin synthase [Arthrobacter sp. H35-D1]MDJ0314316.1 cardiolipin synthase [Arthrobacter sp. H35-D1]